MGADDAIQLAFAASGGRVMVTQDADFLRLHAEGTLHAGIADCLVGALTVGEQLRRLVLIYDLLSAEEMEEVTCPGHALIAILFAADSTTWRVPSPALARPWCNFES
jgi:hypothetical protein